jgi:DNA-binding IclR family transcriptional regulator
MRVSGSSYIERTFAVLAAVNRAERPLTLSDVATRLGLPKPTVLRFLRTLVELGFIESRDGESVFRPTSKIFDLLPADLDGWLKERAAPIMQRLYSELNETVNLGCVDGQQVRYVQIIESTRALRWIPAGRSHEELLITALGRAIVAFSPESRFHAEFSDLCTRAGYTTPAKVEGIRKAIRLARRRGYAEESGQSCRGVSCFAVPLFREGEVVAALSVSVPEVRTQAEDRCRIVAALKSLETELGSVDIENQRELLKN